MTNERDRADIDQLGAGLERVEGDLAEVRADHAALGREHAALRELAVRQFTDLTGVSGANGKVGTLQKAVDKMRDRMWWFTTFALGSIGAAAVKLVLVSRAYGSLETQVHANQARIELLERVVFVRSQLSPPAVTPGKDSP